MQHPLSKVIEAGVSLVDLGVMNHGFADHGRDYVFVLEDAVGTPGLYRLTHVVEMSYETRVSDEVWKSSWADVFTRYDAWQAAGEPDGYVFGTDWSLAYPGLSVPADASKAAAWSERLSRPMHALQVETDRFVISLVFSDARLERLGDGAPTVTQVIVPFPPNEGR
jgi:hypothetical protein